MAALCLFILSSLVIQDAAFSKIDQIFGIKLGAQKRQVDQLLRQLKSQRLVNDIRQLDNGSIAVLTPTFMHRMDFNNSRVSHKLSICLDADQAFLKRLLATTAFRTKEVAGLTIHTFDDKYKDGTEVTYLVYRRWYDLFDSMCTHIEVWYAAPEASQ